jgi:hypothetical protein
VQDHAEIVVRVGEIGLERERVRVQRLRFLLAIEPGIRFAHSTVCTPALAPLIERHDAVAEIPSAQSEQIQGHVDLLGLRAAGVRFSL